MPDKETKKEAADKVESAAIKNQYHFSGEMKYQPLTVEAESIEEAQKIWEEQKQLIK